MVDDRKISTWLSYGTSKICLVLLEDRREICEGITASDGVLDNPTPPPHLPCDTNIEMEIQIQDRE